MDKDLTRKEVWTQVDRDLAKKVEQAEMNRLDKVVAIARKKEFERLREYALNQLSLIEVDLNPQSQSRDPDARFYIAIPSEKDIIALADTLLQLRENILTPDEEELIK